MRVLTVTFAFTKNLGNYQSARAEVTLDVDHQDDDYEVMFAAARGIVYDQLGMPLDPVEQDAMNLIPVTKRTVK